MRNRIRQFVSRVACRSCFVPLLLFVFSSGLFYSGGAIAETRSLRIYYVHTREKAEIVFRKNGRYVSSGLKQLNYLLRDWRRNEPTKMDPRLFDLLWQVYRMSGSRDYIHVISAYRSPQTNNMLRSLSKSSGVARNSQHMLGKAMDFYLPDVSLARLRAIGLRQQAGGVGYYPASGSPFVHMDVGNVRHWPRMSRGELMALFPDGKTMHIPSDGHPLALYAQAVAEYKDRTGRPKSGILAAFLGNRRGNRAGLSLAAEPVSPAPEVQITALPHDSVPVPVAAPVRFDAGRPAEETGDETVTAHVTAYAPESEVAAVIPVPDMKPVEPARVALTENAGLPEDAARSSVPVPVLRAAVRQDIPEGDDVIATTILRNSPDAPFVDPQGGSRGDDAISMLIAQDNFIPLPEEDDMGHEDIALSPADGGASERPVMVDPPADHHAVAVNAVTAPKTSKALIGKKSAVPSEPANRHVPRDTAASPEVELEQVPEVVYALGLQKIPDRPGIGRLSGSAVNFRSVARIAGTY